MSFLLELGSSKITPPLNNGFWMVPKKIGCQNVLLSFNDICILNYQPTVTVDCWVFIQTKRTWLYLTFLQTANENVDTLCLSMYWSCFSKIFVPGNQNLIYVFTVMLRQVQAHGYHMEKLARWCGKVMHLKQQQTLFESGWTPGQ